MSRVFRWYKTWTGIRVLTGIERSPCKIHFESVSYMFKTQLNSLPTWERGPDPVRQQHLLVISHTLYREETLNFRSEIWRSFAFWILLPILPNTLQLHSLIRSRRICSSGLSGIFKREVVRELTSIPRAASRKAHTPRPRRWNGELSDESWVRASARRFEKRWSKPSVAETSAKVRGSRVPATLLLVDMTMYFRYSKV